MGAWPVLQPPLKARERAGAMVEPLRVLHSAPPSLNRGAGTRQFGGSRCPPRPEWVRAVARGVVGDLIRPVRESFPLAPGLRGGLMANLACDGLG